MFPLRRLDLKPVLVLGLLCPLICPTFVNAEAPRVAKFNALSYIETPTGAEGAADVCVITIRQKAEPGLRVGFFDNNVDDTGPMWRSSGWSAATLSCLLLGPLVLRLPISTVLPASSRSPHDAPGETADG